LYQVSGGPTRPGNDASPKRGRRLRVYRARPVHAGCLLECPDGLLGGVTEKAVRGSQPVSERRKFLLERKHGRTGIAVLQAGAEGRVRRPDVLVRRGVDDDIAVV